MDIQTAKQIKIADYLHSLGFSPVKQQGINLGYKSPLREETEASFKVNTERNQWYDLSLIHIYISKQVRFQPNGSAATARYGHRKKVCVRNTWHCQIVRVQSAYRQPYKEKRKDRQSHYANRAQD